MAGASIIDGKAIADGLRRRVGAAAKRLQDQGITPGLAAVLVGNDAASQVYVRSKGRACIAAGLASFEFRLPADATLAAVLGLIEQLNLDNRVDGILVQLPLPSGIDTAAVIAAIDPGKDVDGFHPINAGLLWSGRPGLVPCTPQGILLLLRAANVPLAGAEAVVLGRSGIVGRPVAALLLGADCTVTIAHSKTRDLPAICRRADILVAAIGRAQMVEGRWIKPGAAVVDVGINRIAGEAGNRLLGDVNFEAARQIAGAITPVPGGVGPMTIACLLRNTVLAACRRRGLGDPAGL
ncbi:MAG: bifunctional methylenetetrahydrofolate dehydrogenase/methenyltetrahydrofolate cyclohydrolase FolD [Alphaproteobacteria bacterium]|nr:bifunctional methylenetetrahydrofolate dehydrogenase/methenyltetrahydrofolate cyclohydrolase FolD [Alphaproteobacteria bacterium]